MCAVFVCQSVRQSVCHTASLLSTSLCGVIWCSLCQITLASCLNCEYEMIGVHKHWQVTYVFYLCVETCGDSCHGLHTH